MYMHMTNYNLLSPYKVTWMDDFQGQPAHVFFPGEALLSHAQLSSFVSGHLLG